MADARFSPADYVAALLALLPRGRVWPKDPAATQNGVLQGLAPTYVRLDARAMTLLVDAFPATTVELLPEWEQSLGLPDPCEGADQGLEQRRAQVVTRLASAGGQSVAYFLEVLARLGYPDGSIEQYAPFRADRSVAETPLFGPEWAFAWRVNLPELRVFYFQADISAADEPLLVISNDVAVCVIDALKPAHTTVFYTTDPGPQLDYTRPEHAIYIPAL